MNAKVLVDTQLFGICRVGDVPERESAEALLFAALLDADGKQIAGERRRVY